MTAYDPGGPPSMLPEVLLPVPLLPITFGLMGLAAWRQVRVRCRSQSAALGT